MKGPTFESKYALFWISEEILYAEYKKGLELNLGMATDIVASRLKFQEKKIYPLFADCIGIKSMNKDAREYLALQGSEYLNSCAIIFSSIVHKTIGNFYLNINKPIIPTRLFTDKEEARKWLEPYRKQV